MGITRRLVGKSSEFSSWLPRHLGGTVRILGWAWAEGEGVSSVSGPDSLLIVLRTTGAMWLLSVLCILPHQVA